jgi:hypothetical protein
MVPFSRSLARRAFWAICASIVILTLATPTAAPASQLGDIGSAAACPRAGGVLQADSVPSGLSATDCGLVGRIVRGHQVGAAIPRPGLAVRATADNKDGRRNRQILWIAGEGMITRRPR